MKYIKGIFEEINVKTLTHRGDSILPENNISYIQQDRYEKEMPSELEIY